MVLKTRGLSTGATFMRGSIDIIATGIGNASNFYGRAVYHPNYGTRPPHNGREVYTSSSYAGLYSSIVAAFIANRLSADSLVL